jgi:hypothetical protein
LLYPHDSTDNAGFYGDLQKAIKKHFLSEIRETLDMGQKRECKLEVYFKVGLINPSVDWRGGVVSTLFDM